jgi:antitoxin component of RelBE/YafQ-DinJ toxin-antitoxin module
MKRSKLVGCAIDEELKELFEKECKKLNRTVSTMTLILIKDFLLQKGIDANKGDE